MVSVKWRLLLEKKYLQSSDLPHKAEMGSSIDATNIYIFYTLEGDTSCFFTPADLITAFEHV